MRIAALVFIAALGFLSGFPAYAQPLVSYDTFSGPLIDANKWFGSEFVDEPGVEIGGAEATRRLLGGRPRLTYRAYGGATSSSDVTRSRLRLNFRNPTVLTEIQATVTVHSASTTDCAGNPEPTQAQARISGFFFYTAAPVPGDDTNGLLALIEILRVAADPAGVLRVPGQVIHCSSPKCATAFFVNSTTTLGTTTTGTPVALRIKWVPASDGFQFQRAAMPVEFVSYGPLAEVPGPAASVPKRLEVAHNVANCTVPPRRVAYMDTSFDDVFVNP
jgi:hypothetical protein